MDYLTAIILGITEGATEFIPVSSTGHLIVIREFLGINHSGGLAFDAILQLAATLSLIVYFRKDIISLFKTFYLSIRGTTYETEEDSNNKVLLQAIVIGTIPAVIFGLILENQMATAFRNVNLVAVTLVLGSLLFSFAEYVSKSIYQNGNTLTPNTSFIFKKLNLIRGAIIGLFQVLALFPGVSRSGATISGGLLTGLSKDDAIKYSFLLSIPILLGSGIKKFFEISGDLFVGGYGLSILVGSLMAFGVGLLSIQFLLKYLKNHDLTVFIWYRVGLAGIIFLVSFMKYLI